MQGPAGAPPLPVQPASSSIDLTILYMRDTIIPLSARYWVRCPAPPAASAAPLLKTACVATHASTMIVITKCFIPLLLYPDWFLCIPDVTSNARIVPFAGNRISVCWVAIYL